MWGVYLIICKKSSGPCLTYRPTYVGECGEGDGNFTHRLAAHLASATNLSQLDTDKPIGRHFRLPGHTPHRDLVMIPIEKVSDYYMRKVRENFHIRRLDTIKRLSAREIESGLNMNAGQM